MAEGGAAVGCGCGIVCSGGGGGGGGGGGIVTVCGGAAAGVRGDAAGRVGGNTEFR